MDDATGPAGVAGVVGRLALLEDHGLQPVVDGLDGGRQAGNAAADNDQVVGQGVFSRTVLPRLAVSHIK